MYVKSMYAHFVILPRTKITDGAIALPAFCILILVIPWEMSNSNPLTLMYSTLLDIFFPGPKFLDGSVRHVRH